MKLYLAANKSVELVMEMFILELICFSPCRIHHRVDGVNIKDTAAKFLKILLLVCKGYSTRCVSENPGSSRPPIAVVCFD